MHRPLLFFSADCNFENFLRNDLFFIQYVRVVVVVMLLPFLGVLLRVLF